MIQNLNKKCLNYGFSLRRSWSKNAFISHTPQADFETFARKATQKATPEQANRKGKSLQYMCCILYTNR